MSLQIGEIRIQFHVVTDGHDQMRNSIQAFLDTMNAYGQPNVELLTTDKPWEELGTRRPSDGREEAPI